MNQEQLNLKFDADGLIPAIVQDYQTKQVLTLAYMNRESLAVSIREKKTCFWSRSRKTLWRKGETSGNYQHIVSITADCDRDALVVEVVKDGPACHLGTESCFNNKIYEVNIRENFSIDALYELIKGRKTDKKESSYTSYLFEKGIDKILKKVGEEFEIADLAYHVIVLMVEMGISVNDIRDELEKRHVVDHKVKQEKMQ